jgi:hypothetical protein
MLQPAVRRVDEGRCGLFAATTIVPAPVKVRNALQLPSGSSRTRDGHGACTWPWRRKSPHCQLADNSIASGPQDPSLSQRPSVYKDRRVVPAVNSVPEIAAGSTRPDRVRTPEPPGILVMSGKTSVTATPSGGHPPGNWRKRTVRSARLRCTERPGSMRRCRRRRQT